MTNPLPPHYQSAFWLNENLGNNAFDHARRSEQNPEPQIKVAQLIPSDSQLSNLQPANQLQGSIAFEILDEDQIKAFAGLENFLIVNGPNNQPIYILDNHNHAFYFWHWELNRQNLHPSATLIHIDQHKDSRIPATFITPQEAQNMQVVFEYTNQILNVGNFIPPAFKTGLIKEMLLVDSEKSLTEFPELHPEFYTDQKRKNLILDIDIDFFAPELDYIGNEKKLQLIKQLLPQASCITIATSPFFIDQQLAIEWIKKIFTQTTN